MLEDDIEQKNELFRNKEWLIQKYFIEKLSLREIGRLSNVSAQAIKYHMKKHNINLRSVSESLMGGKLSPEHNANKTKAQTGPGNPFYGRKHSDETKRLLSQKNSGINSAKFGKPLSDELKQKLSIAHTGKVMSDEAKKNMSLSAIKRLENPINHPMFGKQRHDIRGDKHHNWNNGISSLYKNIRSMSKYYYWRQSCFERDDYICQICFERGIELQVDHIKPFSLIIKENNLINVQEAFCCDELWDINNGRTLCVECHRETDTFGTGARILLKNKGYTVNG
jgi:hypothetical protein